MSEGKRHRTWWLMPDRCRAVFNLAAQLGYTGSSLDTERGRRSTDTVRVSHRVNERANMIQVLYRDGEFHLPQRQSEPVSA